MLNYGLLLACHPLADALAVEVLEGDLAPYRGDGSLPFRHAVDQYLAGTAAAHNQNWRAQDWPAEVEGAFAVSAGALAAIMLQFVTLHEFGHVVNGDVDSPDGVGRFSAVRR